MKRVISFGSRSDSKSIRRHKMAKEGDLRSDSDCSTWPSFKSSRVASVYYYNKPITHGSQDVNIIASCQPQAVYNEKATRESVTTYTVFPVPISPRSSVEFDLGYMFDDTQVLPAPRFSRKKKCMFDERVIVHPIPRTRDLPDNTRSSIWDTREVRSRAMKRNAMEYSYEGCNWRNVLEEHEMLYDSSQGEFIHPAHCTPQNS